MTPTQGRHSSLERRDRVNLQCQFRLVFQYANPDVKVGESHDHLMEQYRVLKSKNNL